MQMKWIIWGFLFLCNPNFETVDILPDFIGCILILWGMRRMSALVSKGKEAEGDLLRLLFLNLAKCLSTVLFLVVAKSEMTWMLLLTAVLGTAETVFFVRFARHFEEGTTYLAMQISADEIYRDGKLSSWSGFTVFFAILRLVLSVLPTLTYLVTDYGTVQTIETDWSVAYRLLQGANLLFTLLFGVLLFIVTAKCFRSIGRQDGFFEAVTARYRAEILDAPGVMTYKRLRTASGLLLAGCLFLLPLQADGIDLLPDFLAAALFFAAARILRPDYPRLCRPVFIAGGAYFLLSAGEWTANLLLMLRTGYFAGIDLQRLSYAAYLDEYLYHDESAYFFFLAIVGVSILRAVAMAVTALLLGRVFAAIIREHTGSAEGIRAETTERKTKEMHRSLRRFLTVTAILAVVTAVASVITRALFMSAAPVWLVETVPALLLFAAVARFTALLKNGMDNKYYFDERI